MSLFVLCALLLISEASCAPIEDSSESIEVEKKVQVEGQHQDTPQTSTEKNAVQEWFENLSKDTSTNTQNALNNIKDFFSRIVPNNNQGGGASNLPVMYMGSFQLIKMPMPQIGDVIKGMGDLATAAQTVNKLTGGAPSLPIPIPGLQG